MSNTQVHHVLQNGPTHCGVACLEMIYKHFDIDNVSQDDIWLQRRESRPEVKGYYMRTVTMRTDAIERGLVVFQGQLSMDRSEFDTSIANLLNTAVPFIACIQWEKKPSLGHFIVVTGWKNGNVSYLDLEIASDELEMSLDTLFSRWQGTGQEVIGGQFLLFGNSTHPLTVPSLHLTSFAVPTAKSFRLDGVTFQ